MCLTLPPSGIAGHVPAGASTVTSMSELPTTVLGRTGLVVTKLGYGAMELLGAPRGDGATERADPSQILNSVLDAGINFIDTSPDYGSSEELIGAAISNRRDEFVLASKCGCPVNQPVSASGQLPQHVYTPENIRAGVEQSLQRMRTDHLDVVQIHMSPSRDELEQHGAIDALTQLQSEGKVRFIGMSGTLPNINDHLAMDVFDVFQIPYSALEREHEDVISRAADAGAGTIIRGGVARGAPDKPAPPLSEAAKPWRRVRHEAARRRLERWEGAGLDDLLDGATRTDFMLRFTIGHPNLHTTIVGTANPDHLAANVAAAIKGPLPPDVYEAAKKRLT